MSGFADFWVGQWIVMDLVAVRCFNSILTHFLALHKKVVPVLLDILDLEI